MELSKSLGCTSGDLDMVRSLFSEELSDPLEVGHSNFDAFLNACVEHAKGCSALQYVPVWLTWRHAQILLRRNRCNRKPTGKHATSIKVDMANGTFVTHADPIVIDVEGEMLSGQHRMLALFELKRASFVFNLCFGISRTESLISTDRNKQRTPAQALGYMTDLPTSYQKVIAMSYNAPKVHERRWSTEEHSEVIEMFRDPVQDIMTQMKGSQPRLKRASTLAVFVRLHMMDHDSFDLKHFIDLYKLGPSACDAQHGYYKSAFALREYVMLEEERGSSKARRQGYQKAQQALRAAVEGRKIRRVQKSEIKNITDHFPLQGAALELRNKWDALHAQHRISAATLSLAKSEAKK